MKPAEELPDTHLLLSSFSPSGFTTTRTESAVPKPYFDGSED